MEVSGVLSSCETLARKSRWACWVTCTCVDIWLRDWLGRSVIVYTRAVLSNKTADMRCRRKRDVFGAERDPPSDLEFNLEGIRRSLTRCLKECAFIVDPGPIRGPYTNVAADEEASHASARSVEPHPHIEPGIVALLFVCSVN